MPHDEDNVAAERFLKCLLCNRFCDEDGSRDGTVDQQYGCKQHLRLGEDSVSGGAVALRKCLKNYSRHYSYWEAEIAAKREPLEKKNRYAAPGTEQQAEQTITGPKLRKDKNMAPLRKWHPSGPAAQPSGLLVLELPRRRWGAARSSTVARWSKGDGERDPSLATAEAEGEAVLQGKPASESNWSVVDGKGNNSSVEVVQQENHASESNWSVVDGKGNDSSDP